MYAFEYHKPETIDAAKALFKENEDALYLAGGHTLLPSMKHRLASPSDLIDISAIPELFGLSIKGKSIFIGSMTRHADVAGAADVIEKIAGLAVLAGSIGDAQVRNRGSIGGSIANNDPAADYPAAIVGLGASVHTDNRTIKGDDFFTGMFETALEEGELVVKVEFPIPDKSVYVKFPNPASRYAVVGVFVAVANNKVRVAVTGAASCVFRLEAYEDALAKKFSLASIEGLKVDECGLNSDLHASAGYRAHLVGVMVRRAVEQLV